MAEAKRVAKKIKRVPFRDIEVGTTFHTTRGASFELLDRTVKKEGEFNSPDGERGHYATKQWLMVVRDRDGKIHEQTCMDEDTFLVEV